MSVYKRFSMGTRSSNNFFVFPLFWCLLWSLWSRIDWYRVIASTSPLKEGGGGGGGGGSNYVHVNNIKVLMLISIKEMLKKLFIKFQLKRIYSKIAF